MDLFLSFFTLAIPWCSPHTIGFSTDTCLSVNQTRCISPVLFDLFLTPPLPSHTQLTHL